VINQIDNYIAYNEYAWSPSTLKSESYRLSKLQAYMSMQAKDLYKILIDQGKKPYTIKTTFTRLSKYCDWLIEQGLKSTNPYKEYMKRNCQVFRYSYKRKVLQYSYQDTLVLIDTIKDNDTKAHAMFLLKSGLRISESYKTYMIGDHVYVDGKGDKRRRIYHSPPIKLVNKSRLRRALKYVELTPHDLRKLFATKLVESGMNLHDTCKVMGWSNIQTAMNYLQTSNEDELRNFIKEL